MNWLEITIATAPQGIEDVATALTAEGFSDLLIEDQQEFATFLDKNKAYWDYIDEKLQTQLQGLSQIKLYVQSDDKTSLSRLETLLETMKKEDSAGRLGTLEMKSAVLPDTDWEESWKENYPPQPIGERLIILPYWLSQDTQGRLPVILDPGLTFGTGAHPSTQMVIEAMETRIDQNSTCLDLGSGSGILSIAALRLGAKNAIGIDIDPKAEDIARENASYNGYTAPEFTALTGNVLSDQGLMKKLCAQQYDVVLVNIVADVIIALAPVLPQFLNPDSTLICSGILDIRLKDVTDALERAGLEITNIRAKEDWRCVTAKR